jgi:hypothetical protein
MSTPAVGNPHRPPPRALFLVTGLGEAAQACPVASHASARGSAIQFISTTSQCHDYIGGFGFDDVLLEQGLRLSAMRERVNECIRAWKPDVIFCCNSKTTGCMFFPLERPAAAVVTLDSNWLFDSMPLYFDRFFVTFPRQIFERSRHYTCTDERVEPVGFIPSGTVFRPDEVEACRRSLVHHPEKLVFCYFGRGPTLRAFLVERMVEVSHLLNRERKRAHFVVLSDIQAQAPGLTAIKWLATDREFELHIAAASCTLSHHGMPTIAKAIRQCVPPVTFVPQVQEGETHSAAYEIQPFVDAGLCLAMPYSASAQDIARVLEEILFAGGGDGISDSQRKMQSAEGGESVVFERVLELVDRGRGTGFQPARQRALLVYDGYGALGDDLDTGGYARVIVFSRRRPAVGGVDHIEIRQQADPRANSASSELNMARSVQAALTPYCDVEVRVGWSDGTMTSDPRALAELGFNC